MAGDELLARIANNPDDDDAYLVYADYLTSKDDPHGELYSTWTDRKAELEKLLPKCDIKT
jgi:uncharacterized protein (TIGR02996 family)